MIITIDTAKDSHQDLKKLIKFLQHHVGESIYNSIPSNEDILTPSAGVFDMFDNEPSIPKDNTSSDSISILGDDTQEEDKPEERISILPY